MNDQDDTALVAECLAGDVEAFSVLVQRHRDVVYNLAYSLCGDSAAAEDAAQEAFLRAYRKLSQYKPRYLFRNWVLGICAHVCRSGYRSRERKRRLEQAYADDEGLWREERAQRDDGGNEARPGVEQLAGAILGLLADRPVSSLAHFAGGLRPRGARSPGCRRC